MASASSWSCVTMMVVTPSRRCSVLISSRRRTRTRASSADSGSSSSSSEGEDASARASATRCCWPPDSWTGYLAPCSGRPTSASSSATRAAISRRALRAVDEAVADVVRDASGWETARRTGTRCRNRAAPAAAATRRGRRSRCVPASCGSRPAITRSSVVLPQPEGPRKQTSLPFSTSSETLSSAVNGAEALGQRRGRAGAWTERRQHAVRSGQRRPE